MTLLSKSLLLCTALTLAACGGANRFDDTNGLDGAGGLNGSVSDPSSPAFFQEAIGDRVLFDVDQSSLTPEAIAVLDGQARWLSDNTEYSALIEGHADEQGTREYNLGLGARRANAVLEYLVSRGVASNRVRIVSFGKERPLEICSAEVCYAKNRRAVTVVSVARTS